MAANAPSIVTPGPKQPKTPFKINIDWNKRDNKKLQVIAEHLLNDRPVLLNIRGISDRRRILAAKEMERVEKWAEVLINDNVPSKSTGSVGFPALTQLQEPVEVSDDGGQTWVRYDDVDKAAHVSGINATDIFNCCYQRLDPSSSVPSFTSQSGNTYEFRFKKGFDGRDKECWEIWYGICRSLALFPDSAVGVTMVANATRNKSQTWRKMNVSQTTKKPEMGSPLPENESATKLRQALRAAFSHSTSSSVTFSKKEWENIALISCCVSSRSGKCFFRFSTSFSVYGICSLLLP